jgi:hypothetical protein
LLEFAELLATFISRCLSVIRISRRRIFFGRRFFEIEGGSHGVFLRLLMAFQRRQVSNGRLRLAMEKFWKRTD